MALITLEEILYFIILSVVLGYIFSGIIKRPRTEFDIEHPNRFDWRGYSYAIAISAPAVILHELGHKFVAISYDLAATFKIWPFGLILGAFLKFINSPIILFAPGYVQILGTPSTIETFWISFAGPLVNLVLFLLAWYLLEHAKLSRTQAILLYLTKQINLFLFIFNLLPIPPLDGSKVFGSLIQMLT
ncbi:MAG TPA: M50 family metallopeptidase [Candidatus Nanoarchaeia archaeon]|nr:M50 family metallopeptidase [Candidatus Nanoarchaeia archaeon]